MVVGIDDDAARAVADDNDDDDDEEKESQQHQCVRVARRTFSNDFCVCQNPFVRAKELLTIFINSRRRPQLWRE